MSTFGEFGHLAERRKAELQQRRRKRAMMAGGAVSLLVIVAAVAAVAVVLVNKGDGNGGPDKKGPGSGSGSGSVTTSTKAVVDAICSHTDHKKTCVTSLSKATNARTKPKDFVKAAVSVVYDAVGEAFNKSRVHRSDDPLTHGAVEICDRLLVDSELDLKDTISKIEASRVEDLPRVGRVLNVWLSAVRAYQETCVDAFPEGAAKDGMKKAMKRANELTSNALAIVSSVAKFLSKLNVAGSGRRLLSAEEEGVDGVDAEGFPAWVEGGDRRVLKQMPKPDAVVAKDGSGKFTTINDALKAIPAKRPANSRYVIHVKAGVYDEQVTVQRKMNNVTMYGDGDDKTIVTGNKNFGLAKIKTFQTATFAVEGDGFMCTDMGFRNTAGPEGGQAVALRVTGDCAVFLNCRIEGHQDTLYAHSKRQFYRNCVISGTVDFIFGDAAAVFQTCVIALRRPGPGQANVVTAHGRAEPHEQTGFVVHNCRIVAAEDLKPAVAQFRSYLARPWKAYSRTVFMESEIQELIDPAGYLPWGDTTVGQDTCMYAEYMNNGDGAEITWRAKWKGVHPALTKEEASQFTASAFVVDVGGWSKMYGVPVPLRLGFFQK